MRALLGNPLVLLTAPCAVKFAAIFSTTPAAVVISPVVVADTTMTITKKTGCYSTQIINGVAGKRLGGVAHAITI